jgi:hypothetical protein
MAGELWQDHVKDQVEPGNSGTRRDTRDNAGTPHGHAGRSSPDAARGTVRSEAALSRRVV